jgi:hypothetical protein
MTTAGSARDVVFTPFMLRVRDALSGAAHEPVVLHYEASHPTSIAVAVDEWFGLRARAEHVIAEANAMLEAHAQRIALEDEYGTGRLAFVLRWHDRAWRILVHDDAAVHRARVEVEGRDGAVKPVDQAFLEDLAVSLLSPDAARLVVDQPDQAPSARGGRRDVP